MLAGGLVGLTAPPAAAEVTLTPAQGVQGDASEITFGVSEDRAPGAYTTKIEVVMPDDDPVAEVYPLSADEWAPVMAYRELATALPGIHGGSSTSVVSAITWSRVGAPPTAVTPATVNGLRVSLGPLPQTDNLRFLVVQTYSDGVVKRWTNPVMTLTTPQGQPGQPSQPAGGGHGGNVGNGGHGDRLPGAPEAAGTPAEGGNVGVVVGVIVALVIGVAIGGAVVASSRMKPGGDDPADDPADGTDDGPAGDGGPAASSDARTGAGAGATTEK